MKKLKFILASLLLAGSSVTFAQSDVEAWKGIRVSYDRTFINIDDKESDDLNMNGFSVDYVHAFNVAKSMPIFIETGLGFSFAKYKESESESIMGNVTEYSSSLTTMSLSIPVNFVYGIRVNDFMAIKPYTGLYLKANVSGKATEETTFNNETNKFESNLFDKDDMGEDGTWNRVQVGWQIGTTLDINKFNVGIAYALDFNEIATDTRTSKFMVRLGMNF